MSLYKRIRLRREELGLSQEELAGLLGYKSRSTIAKIEKGENDITQSKIESFAKALQTTPGFLMGIDDATIDNVGISKLIDDIKPEVSSLTNQDEKDITAIIDQMKKRLTRNDLTFEGKPVSPEDIQSILSALQVGMEMARKKINEK